MLSLAAMLQLLIALTTSPYWSTVDRSSVESVARGFFPNIKSQVQITDVTEAGRFGVASFQHGDIEGKTYSGQLLMEKFGFGWQIVDLSPNSGFTTMDLVSKGISHADAQKLLHGTVPGPVSARCQSFVPDCQDHGNANDIEDVRRFMLDDQGEAIGPVRIDSGWAMLEWWGEGGGEALFVKRGNHWEKLSGGGGCMQLNDLRRYGMPLPVAQRFEHWIPCG